MSLSQKKRTRFNSIAVVAIMGFAFAVCGTAQSQTDGDESTRGVRIIGAPTPPSGVGSPSQVLVSPGGDATSPTLLAPVAPPPSIVVPPLAPPAVSTATPVPALLTPAVRPAPSEVPAPVAPADLPTTLQPVPNNFGNTPNSPDIGSRPTPDLEALSNGMKIPNAAGLSMQILPGPDIVAGSQVSFQISSKKAGYLILVDVDATGKLVQIYPNPMSLMAPSGVREQSNYLRPGKALQIPDRQSPYSGFEFVASPPTGTAMVIALLSDRPVQLVDLPDVPNSLVGSVSAVEYLSKHANELRIPNEGGKDRFEEAHWSFDVKFYAIK
jgi:hypothetical protein